MEEKITWLRTVYSETPVNGPDAKRVQVSDIQQCFSQQFPIDAITPAQVSLLIKKAFPNVQSQRVGQEKKTFIVGIEQRATSDTSSQSVQALLLAEQARSEQLALQVEMLESRVRELERSTHDPLSLQVEGIVHNGTTVLHGPDTPARFDEFSLAAVTDELRTSAPDLFSLVNCLADSQRNSASSSEVTGEQHKVVMSLCTLLNARSQRLKGLQLLISFMLVARATSKQAMTTLNHAGICMSYVQTWAYLRQLSSEARYLDVVKSGNWIWVYDNLNVHKAVRHERQDRHSTMLNLTARLAVAIDNLPDWEVDWTDTAPQRNPDTLSISDILPSAADGEEIRKRAVHYIMQFLVTQFESLKHLQPLVPPQSSPHPAAKSTVIPMKILFKDEKYKAETIDILKQLLIDAELTGKPEVVVGDQLTCKNIRGSRKWREAEHTTKDCLTWANEVPGDFHFVWECLRVVFTIFWGSPAQIGSLCNLREYVQRLQVDKSVKTFNTGDEFVVHAFKGHLMAAVCTILKVNSPQDPVSHDSSLEWLQKTSNMIVTESLFPVSTSCTDPIHKLHRAFLHTVFLYIDLRNAIRWEDGVHIIRHWKLWLPRLAGTGCKNYAVEAANLIANTTARFPRHISYIVTHNRTVNMDGRPGHGKPLDQMMEHYNL